MEKRKTLADGTPRRASITTNNILSNTHSSTSAATTVAANHPNNAGYEVKDITTATTIIMNQSIPHTMESLANRYDNFQQIAQHLEDEYIASRRSGVEDQTNNVINQTKRCLQEGIAALAVDVYSMAEQLDILLTLQSSAVDSVTSQVDLLKTRYTAAKEQHLSIQLEEMQLPEVSSTAKTSTNKISIEDIPVERMKLPKHMM